MVLELLNIVMFLLYVLVGSGTFYYTKKSFVFLKWKHYCTFILITAIITHNQFFTLTEKEDTVYTQNTMLRQVDKNKNSKTLGIYLKDEEKFEVPEENFEEELLKQQMKSKALAEDIDNRNKGE